MEWYASAGNIEDFETALKEGDIVDGEEGIAWTKALIREMKKHRGGFVIHPYDQGESGYGRLRYGICIPAQGGYFDR